MLVKTWKPLLITESFDMLHRGCISSGFHHAQGERIEYFK